MSQDRQRQALLANVSGALGGSVDQRRVATVSWLQRAPVSVLPRAAQSTPNEELSNFVARARAAAAVVEMIGKPSDIPEKLEATLAERPIAGHIVASADPVLGQWLGERLRASLRFGCPAPSDKVSIAIAAAAIAETGTLVFVSGPLSPASLAFLPERLIAIVPASRIVASYNSVIPELLTLGSSFALPRCVNFVTGPSRTADIEELLLIGAHGPRSVEILVVEGV